MAKKHKRRLPSGKTTNVRAYRKGTHTSRLAEFERKWRYDSLSCTQAEAAKVEKVTDRTIRTWSKKTGIIWRKGRPKKKKNRRKR